MIKPEELRIGNLVRTTGILGKELQVTSIGEVGINPSLAGSDSGAWIEHEAHFDKLEGIPLTEEWLEKFRFEKIANSQFVQFWNQGNVTLYHEYYNDLNYIELSSEGARGSLSQIKFVHQLQNLYFALTGEELKMSLIEKTS